MKKPIMTFNMLIVLVTVLLSIPADAQHKPSASKTLKSSGYAPVNGLKMYYEIHGDGKPLVLLHGSYMTIDLNFAQLIPELAKNHKVIALEMQGHGRTGDIDRAYSYSSLASDIDGLLNHLKIDSADILGYSLGGTVAFELAIKHPERVTSLVIISSVFRLNGWIKSARDIFPTIKPEFFENTPLKTEYDRLAPDKSHWKDWVNKMVASEIVPFDLGADNIKALKCPVLIISGDNDGVDLNHVAEMYRLCGGGVFGDIAGLPKSRLAILPGMTHVTLMMETAKLVSIINPFLN
ncbi:MAG TPA: alpha/beta hydrolase [Chryseolinea sp.]